MCPEWTVGVYGSSGPGLAEGCWGEDLIHRAGQPLGEWLCGELQRKTERRAPQCRDLRHVVGSKGASREVAKGVQPETASQRLGLSASGAGGQTPQVTSTRFCSGEWTSSGPKSNLEGGLVRGGRSVLRKELEDRLEAAGSSCQWSGIVYDLDLLEEIGVEQKGRRFLRRTEARGVAGCVFQAAGVALPSTVRRLEAGQS